jgi:Domain of unknown function (DUF5916)
VKPRNSIAASIIVAGCFLIGTLAEAQAPKANDPVPVKKNGQESAAPAETDNQSEQHSLKVGVLPKSAILLDGVLNEEVWAEAEAISNLTTIEPEEGGVPVGKTIVKVLANPTEIIIGVLCNDPDPSGIVSNSKARDAELDDEDHIAFVIDTFRDQRSGYAFVVNPSGTRFEGLITAQGTDVNSNWDTVWEARTARDSSGWSAEIRIPIQSIGFNPGLTAWGFNVERRVQRLQESSRWASATQDYEIYQMSRAGLLTDLPKFDVGLGLSIRPAFTTGAEKLGPDEPRTGIRDFSLDVTEKLGANLLSSLTVNTDFAETEVDVRQTNLTRFEIFFPEKRTFFLEGADIFDFGMGLQKVLIPFFSRRIGLTEEGIQIPINAGGKLNGRVGNTNVGALAVNTRNVDSMDVGEATMGVARVKQNIFAESSIGAIATFGDQLGRTGSWMSGADFTYQTSTFQGDKNLLAGGWALVNRRDDLEGDRKAYGFGVLYPNDRWNLGLTSARIGDGFDPSFGFVPRQGVHVWEGAFAFEPRPGKAGIRQMHHGTDLFLVNDLDNQWQSYEWRFKPFDWLMESGERFGFTFSREGDRPDEDFALFESETEAVIVPAGDHEWRRYGFEVSSAPKRLVSGELKQEFGSFYGGDLKSTEAAFVLRQSLLKIEVGLEHHVGDALDWTTFDPASEETTPGGKFTQNLYNTRLEFKFSPDLQLSSFVQYDNESSSLGTNTRLRWTFHPFGDLFVVYNHNLQRAINDFNRHSFEFDSNVLMVKLQYAWRP